MKEFGDAPSVRTAELAQNALAVVDLGNENTFWISSDEKVGLRCIHSTLDYIFFWIEKLPKAKLLQIGNSHLKFELIKGRIPYYIMWYSIYKELERIGGYRGADEIDISCLVTLVSFFTAFLISYDPGPCVFIKPENTDHSHSEL